jgi:hypothetical protein
MSSAAVELRPVATPGRVGQATAVEQSRAVAEVQAAVIVAQQCPRSVTAAIEAMKDACSQIELAGEAFFEYPRAGETVSGPTVHLARELARCWGNIQYGIRELARDDFHGQSEMQAWAWDVQTNTRSSSDFIVPHKRDTKKGVKDLTDMRDIYENNANNGARRLREAIFTVLPVWFRARAEKLCLETMEKGGGLPLAQRIADAVSAFEQLRVTPAQIAAKFGRATVDDLTAAHVARLGVIYTSIRQGTVTVAEEFPEEAGRITVDDLAPPKNVPPAGEQPQPPSAAADRAPGEPAGGTRKPQPASSGQVGMIRKKFAELYPGEETDEERYRRLARTAALAGADYLGTTKELSADEAARVLVALGRCKAAADLEALLKDGEVPGE